MAFYDGHGNAVASPSGGVSITEHNLFDTIGGILVDGYTTSGHSLSANSANHVIYAKLTAGKNYLFAFDAQAIIHIVDTLPDVETWKKSALTTWEYYGWVQNFWTDQNTKNGTYIYTPTKDVYVLAGVEKDNKLYAWDAELTGNVNPGASIGGSGFSTWNQTGNSYSSYPFDKILNETEDIQVSEESRKGAIKSADINRIYSGNVPIYWVGDSIMYAASNVGLVDCYRYNASKALDLPWNYHAIAGTTITDGYGVSWDSSDSTKTGYSGFVATEDGAGKAQTSKELLRMCKMVVLAIGTNDFGNDAPLGTAADTGTDTFYGAFRAWLTYFHTNNPNLPIIVVTPFKRDTWATPNEQNLILPDYIRAMYRIAREFKHVYLLDVFSKWYGDTDNQAIRARNSIDGIHPSAWFHDCFTMDLVQKIKEVCALEGIIA